MTSVFEDKESSAASARRRTAYSPSVGSVSNAPAAPLDRLLGATPGIQAAILLSGTGAQVSSARLHSGVQVPTATMASSMLALGAAMAFEAGLGACRNAVIEAADGQVVLLSVDADPAEGLLCVVTDRDAMLGEVLWAARRCCQQVLAARGVPAKAGPPRKI